jgi:phosphomannomutase
MGRPDYSRSRTARVTLPSTFRRRALTVRASARLYGMLTPMPTPEPTLRDRATRWMQDDPDPATQAELAKLLAAPDLAKTDLADRFATTLEFGTAGLRGVLGAGPNRMNRAVVLTTSLGLAQYTLAAVPNAGSRGIVIGYDGRHYSRQFAEDAALVFAAAGIRALLFTHVVPTPVTSFAVKELAAAAGVMVTASHNPPEYNGYKVYWTNSAQIIPPVDHAIAEAIAKAPAAKDVPRLTMEEARARGLVQDVGAEIEERYLGTIRALAVHSDGIRSLTIVYTPMHGVGDVLARRALARAGFDRVTSVPEQQHPDADFPTVAFPNPEEKGAMDLAFALARKQDAHLVIANDPDADRLAVAVPGRAAGAYVQLTGNQVGILLGHYLLTERPPSSDRRVVLASIVSSPMLGSIARALEVHYEETLTGFKWIANRAMQLESEGYAFVFGYEEALGYSVGDAVRDKDGISAALLVAEMCAVLAARKRTLLDELDAIYRQYGVFVSSQVSLTRKGASGAAEITALMTKLRAESPKKIGEHAVIAVSDFEMQKKTTAEGVTTKLTFPVSNVLVFDLEGGSRIIARPSGTEPKVKFYFDVRETVAVGESVEDAEKRANATAKKLSDAFQALVG